MMTLPKHVTICEVGPRDGFQIEPEWIPTETKVEVIDRLAETGLPRIEVTSFVHPKVVPQMRDAEEVMARIRRRPGTQYIALVPNEKGAVRAIDAGVDGIHTVVSASESHNLANVNMTVAESLGKLRAVLEVAAAREGAGELRASRRRSAARSRAMCRSTAWNGWSRRWSTWARGRSLSPTRPAWPTPVR